MGLPSAVPEILSYKNKRLGRHPVICQERYKRLVSWVWDARKSEISLTLDLF